MKCVFYRRNVSENYYNNFSFSTCQKKAQTVVSTLVGSKDIKNTEHTLRYFYSEFFGNDG